MRVPRATTKPVKTQVTYTTVTDNALDHNTTFNVTLRSKAGGWKCKGAPGEPAEWNGEGETQDLAILDYMIARFGGR